MKHDNHTAKTLETHRRLLDYYGEPTLKERRDPLSERYRVPFTLDAEATPERPGGAAHSTSRILHVNDATGRGIQEKLVAALRACPTIELLTGMYALDDMSRSRVVAADGSLSDVVTLGPVRVGD